ncbi:hypothetical protein Q5P01_022921 [Channa striata]|uniref:Uncharacterized protein n=1 Tax=Channa striata TaxID=64152 RepID=A0AA88LRY0_CHASR|nr:hypothetical protein Q5P01_022921 [Channa striata]
MMQHVERRHGDRYRLLGVLAWTCCFVDTLICSAHRRENAGPGGDEPTEAQRGCDFRKGPGRRDYGKTKCSLTSQVFSL